MRPGTRIQRDSFLRSSKVAESRVERPSDDVQVNGWTPSIRRPSASRFGARTISRFEPIVCPYCAETLIGAEQLALHADHRLLGGPDDIIAVDAVVVAGLIDVDAGEGVFQQQCLAQPADVRAGGRKRRLLRETTRDPRVGAVVVLNLPAAAVLDLPRTAPCRREPRRDVVGVLLDQRCAGTTR